MCAIGNIQTIPSPADKNGKWSKQNLTLDHKLR